MLCCGFSWEVVRFPAFLIMDWWHQTRNAGTQMCFLSPLLICGHPRFWEYSQVLLLLEICFRVSLHVLNLLILKSYSRGNCYKCIINLNDWLLTDCGHLFLSIIVILFQYISAGLQGFCLWGESPITNWYHRYLVMEKITCSGLGNGNVFHSVLSTVSLFSIHQSRYLILRHSSAGFHPFHASYRNTCLWSSMCVLV